MTIGYEDNGVFVEINDSDLTPVVRGRQGFYMIVLRLLTNEALPADSFCLTCRQRVAPIETYEGVDYDGALVFRRSPEDDFTAPAFLIMGGPELESVIDGATTTLSIDCVGHGVSGSVSRSVELFLDGDV